MLAYGCQRYHNEGYGCHHIELWKGKGGKTEPSGILDCCKADQGMLGEDEAEDEGEEVASKQAQEYRDDAEEPLGEDVCHNSEGQGDSCDRE